MGRLIGYKMISVFKPHSLFFRSIHQLTWWKSTRNRRWKNEIDPGYGNTLRLNALLSETNLIGLDISLLCLRDEPTFFKVVFESQSPNFYGERKSEPPSLVVLCVVKYLSFRYGERGKLSTTFWKAAKKTFLCERASRVRYFSQSEYIWMCAVAGGARADSQMYSKSKMWSFSIYCELCERTYALPPILPTEKWCSLAHFQGQKNL